MLAALGYLQLGDLIPTPDVGDIEVPTLLLAGAEGAVLRALRLTGLDLALPLAPDVASALRVPVGDAA